MTLAPTYRRPPGPVKITVDQYHRMVDGGILQPSDQVELLEGQLVRKDRSDIGEDPMSVGRKHSVAIAGLVALDAKLQRLGCSIRIQSPITIPPHDEPEPDGAIVRGLRAEYLDKHPGPADIHCVIEVSASSLAEDRGRKQRIYAAAGIRQYVILNLADDVIEEYVEPNPEQGRYSRVTPYARSKRIELRLGSKILPVSVSSLLP